MKILMLSSYLPYPLIDGGSIRLYNLLKILNKKHEITFVCEKRNHQSEDDVEIIRKLCKKLIIIERPKAISPRNITKSVLSLNPLLTVTHTNKKLKDVLRVEIQNSKYDLIHVETFYVMQNLPKTNIPIVLVEHNIEYAVYEKFAKNSSLLIRLALFIDIQKLKRKEKDAWIKATKLVAVSPHEQKIMGPETELVPNGVNLDKFKYIKKKNDNQKKKVLFIGNFKWVQNRDAAVFIIKNVWPQIRNKNKNIYLWVVGKNIPESIKKLESISVQIDENAPSETELIFQSSDLLLSPIRVGGGSNFKTLESMACGTPVVTSDLGNEGIQAKDGLEIQIANKPDEYATKTLSILEDDYLYEKVARNGRAFVENKYDWKEIASMLNKVYLSTLSK